MSGTRLTRIAETTDIPAARDMSAELVRDQETVVRTARPILPLVNDANDGSPKKGPVHPHRAFLFATTDRQAASAP